MGDAPDAAGSGAVAGEAVAQPRDDRRALTMLFNFVQERWRLNADGREPLPKEDIEFLQRSNVRISQIGLAGGLVTGGAAMVLFRNARPVVRIPGVIIAWLAGSGTGRAMAAESSIENMFQLQSPSVLGSGARAILRENAEPNGFFARRYNFLDIKDTPKDELSSLGQNESFLESYFDSKPIGSGGNRDGVVQDENRDRNTAGAGQPGALPSWSESGSSSGTQSSTFESNKSDSGFSRDDTPRGTADPFASSFDPFADPEQANRPSFLSGPGDDPYSDVERFRNVPRRSWDDLRRERQAGQHQRDAN
mmetsp:Transcript_1539/g.4792  ORF Transcript_1539/g.4792 Transcript_1539/m.4792 type:complete len:307 (+) Transcript_1539:216-1136(+)